jgi:hypothetical protein
MSEEAQRLVDEAIEKHFAVFAEKSAFLQERTWCCSDHHCVMKETLLDVKCSRCSVCNLGLHLGCSIKPMPRKNAPPLTIFCLKCIETYQISTKLIGPQVVCAYDKKCAALVEASKDKKDWPLHILSSESFIDKVQKWYEPVENPDEEYVDAPVAGGSTAPSRMKLRSRISDVKSPTSLQKDNWVMCDNCRKWRSVPANMHLKDFADHPWECSMNYWAPKLASCEANEEEDDIQIDNESDDDFSRHSDSEGEESEEDQYCQDEDDDMDGSNEKEKCPNPKGENVFLDGFTTNKIYRGQILDPHSSLFSIVQEFVAPGAQAK